jgi:hypothetical protein
MCRCFALGLGVLFSLSPLAASAREWTDISGRYRIEAEFVAYRADEAVVVLRKESAQIVHVRYEKLSVADRDYVTRRVAKDSHTEAKSEPRRDDDWVGRDLPSSTLTALLPPAPDAKGEVSFTTAILARALAKQQQAAAPEALPSAPQAPRSEQEADQLGRARLQGRTWRHVYYAHHAQFHLAPDHTGTNIGTALYWWPPRACWIHLLDTLTFDKQQPSPRLAGVQFVTYRASPNAPVYRWAFSLNPWVNGCHHVWYQMFPGGPYRFYGYAHRERVF